MPNEGYYTTDSVVEQRAIETSKRYLRGEIVCVDVLVIAEGVMPEVVTMQAQAVEVVNGIATVQAAREYLVDVKGAKASELNNREAVLAYAERVGVKFAEL
jgi:phosphoribosylformimino-5-aminoimidazole carboxamide ribonucleotide (ProFAR) isomerase